MKSQIYKVILFTVISSILIVSCKKANETRDENIHGIIENTSIAILSMVNYMRDYRSYLDGKILYDEYVLLKSANSRKIKNSNKRIKQIARRLKLDESNASIMINFIIEKVKGQLHKIDKSLINKKVMKQILKELHSIIRGFVFGVIRYSKSEEYIPGYIDEQFDITVDDLCDSIFSDKNEQGKYRTADLLIDIKATYRTD